MGRAYPSLAVTLIILIAPLVACSNTGFRSVDEIAERYVMLVLATGELDPDYVDAYYGPAEWRDKVRQQTPDLKALIADARTARTALASISTPSDTMSQLRHDYLARQLDALISYLEILDGKTLSFDAEAKALYDVAPPHFSTEHFETILAGIEQLVPGDGPLSERVQAFRDEFIIPADRLPAVFEAALQECRKRTLQYIELPDNETFRVEYVTDKPWSGYNWYQGNADSLIQVNTELPVHLDRAVHLGCHEGYPGHHTYNALLETELVDKRGWIEYTVYPLFSPQSLIAEGTANYGVELAFPGDEQLVFEREVLAPMAGIDTERLDDYAALRDKLRELDYAGNEAARAYLNGERDRDETIAWLVEYGLYSQQKAEQRVKFFDAYRSYVINYNLGRDLVRNHIERDASSHTERWQRFAELLGSPRLPSGLN